MDAIVRHAEDRSRYELVLDDQVVGIADYRRKGDVVVMHHTLIVGHLRGQGYGAQLVQGALDDVKAKGAKVEPTCWFVREFIEANEEYEDLVA
jgi:predicted GNAT family acetyltransferase